MEFGDLRSLVHEIKSSESKDVILKLTSKLVYDLLIANDQDGRQQYAVGILSHKNVHNVNIGDLLKWFSADTAKTFHERVNEKHECAYDVCVIFICELALSVLNNPQISPPLSMDSKMRMIVKSWGGHYSIDEEGEVPKVNQSGWCVHISQSYESHVVTHVTPSMHRP